jgi:NhaC family Na+:H+ antiporter
MSTERSEMKETKPRTPSLIASLLVLGVMVGLILFAVFLFGQEVASGPLQVSITLATLFALAVAYGYGHRGALISEAIGKNINSALGTIFILVAIGAVIGALYLGGTVAAFVYYGVELLSPRFFYISVFALASVLSILTGSSFTTVGAVCVAFVGLASLMGVSPAITAGAAVSGAFLGDKLAKISDTLVLTTAVVGGVSNEEHARSVLRTAVPTWIISAALYLVLGLTGPVSGGAVDLSQAKAALSTAFNVTPLAFLPIVTIFVLSSLRLSGFISLMVSAVVGVVLAAFTQPDLIVRLSASPALSYPEQATRVGIATLAHGFALDSGVERLDQLFSGGGSWDMFETIWLILMATSFGAVVDASGMIQRVIAPVIKWSRTSFRLLVATAVSGIGCNVFTADPYVSIVLTGKMYRREYMRRQIKPVALSTVIADSGSMFSPLIPWNVHGAFVAGAMGIGVASFAPYAFMCSLSGVVTLVIGYLTLQRQKLPRDADAAAIYGKEPAHLPEPKLTA